MCLSTPGLEIGDVNENPHRHAFVVELRAEHGVDGIRSFRALLKAALRHYGLRAIDARELDECAFVFPSHPPRSTRETTMSAFSERIRANGTGFFKVADLENIKDKELTFTISRLDEECEMFNKTVDLLNFEETGQQLQLNQTTSEWLLDAFGDNPETYPGKRVTLYLGEYEYQKEKKKGIRLKLPGATTATAAAAPAPARSPNPKADRKLDRKDDLDDSIPF